MMNHMFSNVITFHAGETSITYPWGGDNHYLNQLFDRPPDEIAYKKFVRVLRIVAGHVPRVKEYITGNINEVVYGGKGCMEDWGYAAGWEYGQLKTSHQSEVDNNILMELLQDDRAYTGKSLDKNDKQAFSEWPMINYCTIKPNPFKEKGRRMRQAATVTADYTKATNIRPNIILIETSDSKNPAEN